MLTATLTSLVKQAITTQLSQSTASFQRENFYVCVCVCVFKQIFIYGLLTLIVALYSQRVVVQLKCC